MRILLTAINAKYIHSNLAVYNLKAVTAKYGDQIEIAEYTINQQPDEILADIYKKQPDVIAFSTYIWNRRMVGELIEELPKVLPQAEIWAGTPDESYDAEAFLMEYPKVRGVMRGEGAKNRKGGALYADLRDVLEKGEVPPRYFLSAGYLETLERHKVRQNSRGYGFGMKVVNDPSIEHPISCALLATGGSGRERNLVYDIPNGEKYAGLELKGKYSPINSKCIRTMTPSEWGKLQGFINYAFLNEDGSEGFSFPDSTDFGSYSYVPISRIKFSCRSDIVMI